MHILAQNLTTKELISEHYYSDDPILHAFARRMEELLAEKEESERIGVQLENELEACKEELDSLNKDYHESLNQLDEVEEQLNDLLEEQSKGETEMLETQIEKMAERIGTVEDKLATTNELLGEILSAIRHGGSVPPAPANIVKGTSAKGKEKVEIVADNTANKPAAKAIDRIDIEDIREALMTVKATHGRNPAYEIVKKFTTGALTVGNIPQEKYSEVMAACEALNQKEAA